MICLLQEVVSLSSFWYSFRLNQQNLEEEGEGRRESEREREIKAAITSNVLEIVILSKEEGQHFQSNIDVFLKPFFTNKQQKLCQKKPNILRLKREKIYCINATHTKQESKNAKNSKHKFIKITPEPQFLPLDYCRLRIIIIYTHTHT